jgi:hypothetical protein
MWVLEILIAIVVLTMVATFIENRAPVLDEPEE